MMHDLDSNNLAFSNSYSVFYLFNSKVEAVKPDTSNSSYVNLAFA